MKQGNLKIDKNIKLYKFLEKMIIEEKKSPYEAIHFYTSSGAYVSFEENYKGKLLPDFLADIVILDRDIFNENIETIRDTKVVMTTIDGEVIYQN